MTRIQLPSSWIISAILCLLALPTGASAGFVVTEMLFNQRVHFAGGATDSAASIAIVNPFSQTLTAQLESTVAESTYEFQWDELTGTGDYRSTFEHSSNPVHMTTRIFDRVRFDTDAPTKLRVHGFLDYAVTGTSSYFDIDFYIWVDTGDGNVTILWAEVGTDNDDNRSGIVEFDQEVLIDANKSAFFHASLGSEAMPTHFSANGEVNVTIRPTIVGGNECNADGITELDNLTAIERKLVPSDADAQSSIGIGVSIRGDRMITGAESDSHVVAIGGAAYIFGHTGGDWIEDGKLVASDAAPFDLFGHSVSISGDTAIVGAPGNDDDGNDSGAAYVFRFVDSLWQEETKLTASDGAAENDFGDSVAIDGDVVVVGAPGGGDAVNYSGSAYVFRRIAGVWQEEAELTASDAAAGDKFGTSVFLDADSIIIGASSNDNSGNNSGAAYVFRHVGGTWQQEATLIAPLGDANDSLGVSVAIDGDLAIAGAPGGDVAHVFRRNGTNWQHDGVLMSSTGATGGTFGFSVAIEGDLAIVGNHANSEIAPAGGASFVFGRELGNWNQLLKLTPAGLSGATLFGYSVAIDAGSIASGALAGSPGGAVYVHSLTTTGDCNANGIPDECDIDGVDPDNNGLVSTDCNGDGIPDECRTPGDTNGDEMVDLGDVPGFVAEALGQVDCRFGDFNADGMTDGHDVGLFAAALLGS